MWNRLTIVHEMQDLFPTRHLHHIGRTPPQALGSSGLALRLTEVPGWSLANEWIPFFDDGSQFQSENMNHIEPYYFWNILDMSCPSL